jgi:CDP-paratose 2-epimerase
VKILVTGACGFVGSSLIRLLREYYSRESIQIVGFDNLSRAGVHLNLAKLRSLDVQMSIGDQRMQSDLDDLPTCDWVIDAAANASVLAGTSGNSSRLLIENNLVGTLQLLELCKRWSAGMILLSTSRVYSLEPLCSLPMLVEREAYEVDSRQPLPVGVSTAGVSENFSSSAPVSLYGATKLASEQMALEYSMAFNFPVWINRCGVMAGAGQFGKADQGIFSFWLHSWRGKRPLKYIGFDGMGHQVRDCLHPSDLFSLIDLQIHAPRLVSPIINVAGGVDSAMSLRQLSNWCSERWGSQTVATDPQPRNYDVPWLVLDSANAKMNWDWQPRMNVAAILEEIARFAEQNPDWLDVATG